MVLYRPYGYLYIKEKFMQANLARKNRRIPVLSILLLLLSAMMSAIASSSSFVVPAIFNLKNMQAQFSLTELIRTVATAIAHNAVTISSIFFLLLVFVLLFKPKGWAVSFTAVLASIFMLAIGIIVAATSLSLTVGLINGTVPGSGADSIPSAILDIIICLLPATISFSWFALALAGISSMILHRTAKKAIRYSFGALTVAFGLIASGMFVISSFGNILAAAKEAVAFWFYDSIGFTYCTNAPTFIFANSIGFLGILLLTYYLISPYKKSFLPHETDPEIIYAIDEDDPVFHEIDGIVEEDTNEACEIAEVEENTDAATEESSDTTEGGENEEAPKKKKRLRAYIKKLMENRTVTFKIALGLTIAALILELGTITIPFIGIATLIAMFLARKRTTVIVFGIVNMVLGGGPVTLLAGIFMLFIPEASLRAKAPEKIAPEEAKEEDQVPEATVVTAEATAETTAETTAEATAE